ncbi:hypothetical protein R3W88_033473 [Solanum pinnatisectum]|uniref:Uncharacterized protein n=1 Tax=Solanum pinnatisectum TaxID=50273 RepID=A0AAV9K1X9_9SOLN|nr:hypothetical protein R3W88_033473 [Solanum pinnatisectum]
MLDRLTILERVLVRAPEGAFPVRDGLLPNPIQKAKARLPIPPPKWELPSFKGNEPKEELSVRFGETVVEDTVEEFNKLSQIGTVDEFLGKSEDLKAQLIIRNPALNEAHFLSSFIGALKVEIKFGVKMFKPLTLRATIEQASVTSRHFTVKFCVRIGAEDSRVKERLVENTRIL